MLEIITKIDSKGRILIPKKLRRELNLANNENVIIRLEGGKIIIEPLRNIRRVKAKKFEEAFLDAGEAAFGF